MPAKAALALRVWRSYVVVMLSVKRTPLARLTRGLGRNGGGATRRPPELLSHAVGRSLRIGRHQPRCLVTSLVLFKLLREQGDDPELVIGLPEHAVDHLAHAWIELEGRDVGPPPGQGRHVPLARYS
jgi:Transglutaminase-like superfamily